MVQVNIDLHPELETIVKFAPVLKDLINAEVTIIICDTEKIVEQIVASELNFGEVINKPLEPHDPMIGVLENKKMIVMNVPKEIYGVPFRGAITPLFSKQGDLIGCFSINTTLTNQLNLIEVAGKLTEASEEMSASTVELSGSAEKLKNSIEHLSSSQADMYSQVDSSSKMLDMITSVAKNTRILGLNAGIEAARSGEHGKGFSVVAKEITKLAELSADSANEIRELMQLLKKRVTDIEQIVFETSEISDHQFHAIHEISEAMHQLSHVAEKIEGLSKKV